VTRSRFAAGGAVDSDDATARGLRRLGAARAERLEARRS
jgi:hypothetical protein